MEVYGGRFTEQSRYEDPSLTRESGSEYSAQTSQAFTESQNTKVEATTFRASSLDSGMHCGESIPAPKTLAI